jgi:hypothetical protein
MVPRGGRPRAAPMVMSAPIFPSDTNLLDVTSVASRASGANRLCSI